MSGTKRRSITWYTRFVGLLLFVVLLVKVDIQRTFTILLGVRWLPLVLAIALNIPQLGLKALRWRFLLDMQGVPYRMCQAVLAYFSSVYIGLLTPGRLGEFVKALYLKQETNLTVGQAVSSVLLDRVFDLYALIGAGFYGLIIFAELVRPPAWLSMLIIVGWLLSLLILWPAMGQFVLRLFVKIPGLNRYGLRLDEQVQGFYTYLVRLFKPRVVFAVILTLAAHSVFYLQCYLLVLALGLPLQFDFMLFSMALVNLVNLLPISISGLGTREAILSLLFASVSVTSDAAVAYSVLVVVTFYIAAAGVGAFAWSLVPLDPGLLRRARLGDV